MSSFDKLVIRSESRNNALSTSTSNFVIVLTNTFYFGSATKFKLDYLLMPTAYNINSLNQGFQVKISTTVYNVSIAIGLYDANSATAVQTALTSAVSKTLIQ